MIRYLLPIICILALSNCADSNSAKMSQYENQAIETLAEGEAERIEKVNNAHSETIQAIASTEGATAGEKILGMNLVASSYSKAATSRMPEILEHFTRDKKNTDVQVRSLQTAEKLAWPVATVRIVDTVSKNAGDTTYQNEGDVRDSGNRQESHMVIGDENEGVTSSAERVKDESVTETDDHSNSTPAVSL